jgi:aspartyl/asparaginyl beta-hydroxylase (cupin superfamily)
MMMNWKSCLTYHHDETPRIHLPLVTNDGCFMIIDDKTEKLHESTAYLVDTTKRHTALNAGQHLRFHMVFCLPPVKDGRTKNQLEFDLE